MVVSILAETSTNNWVFNYYEQQLWKKKKVNNCKTLTIYKIPRIPVGNISFSRQHYGNSHSRTQFELKILNTA